MASLACSSFPSPFLILFFRCPASPDVHFLSQKLPPATCLLGLVTNRGLRSTSFLVSRNLLENGLPAFPCFLSHGHGWEAASQKCLIFRLRFSTYGGNTFMFPVEGSDPLAPSVVAIPTTPSTLYRGLAIVQESKSRIWTSSVHF